MILRIVLVVFVIFVIVIVALALVVLIVFDVVVVLLALDVVVLSLFLIFVLLVLVAKRPWIWIIRPLDRAYHTPKNQDSLGPGGPDALLGPAWECPGPRAGSKL